MQRKALLTRYCRTLAALFVLLLLVSPAGHAQVYKFVDEHGIVNYTNIAPPKNVSYQTLRFPCYAADPKCRSVNWENTQACAPEMTSAARVNALDESLIRAIIHAESAYQSDAVSPKGAQGLMQLMPDTQQLLQIEDPFNPQANIAGGARYLSELLREFKGNTTLAAAAYNAGPGAVQKYGGVPPFEETREYVRRVNILHRRYRQAGS
jgi:soluble lytic murein transglycosylase-like protein